MSTPDKVWRQWSVYCPACNRWHGNTVTGCNNCNRYLLLVERFSIRLRLLRCTGCLLEFPALVCRCQAAIPAKLIDGLDDLPAKKTTKANPDGPGVLGCIVWLFLAALVLTYCHHREPTRPAAVSPTPAPSAALHTPAKPTPTKAR